MQGLKGFSAGAKRRMLTSSKDIQRATPRISMHSNKYSRGSVLIIAGSGRYSGAMKLAASAAAEALAALRTESGYVTIAGPKRIVSSAARISPVFVIRELSGPIKKQLSIIKSIRHDAVILGPGLEPANIKLELLKGIIKMEKSSGNCLVVDGAAIRALANHRELINNCMVLTPHDGEFKALAGINLKGAALKTRISAAKKFAAEYNCILALKGHKTVITDGKRLKVNVPKSPALATMGTGDVLAGMIASYLALHKDAFEGAVAAVHAHSMIGDKLYKKKGEHITAQDVAEAIPEVLKQFDITRK
ncbi:MAG: NAD(P)H-hydrate dehydratase [Candidatus Micrarchaeota archaeon]|nr:NAD(P)H-hydrate dehydratase [Candidatus Micrarchaeota archaeon]